MSVARFNHMELTLPPGSLDGKGMRAEIARFFGEIFGWKAMDVSIVGQNALLLAADEAVSQFILITEMENHLRAPGYDHLGLLHETRQEVDELLEKCKKYRERDPRVQIKEYEDLRMAGVVTHAFYVKHLLPIWFDVQCIEYPQGGAPARRWTFA
jgi:hypothetical protein